MGLLSTQRMRISDTCAWSKFKSNTLNNIVTPFSGDIHVIIYSAPSSNDIASTSNCSSVAFASAADSPSATRHPNQYSMWHVQPNPGKAVLIFFNEIKLYPQAALPVHLRSCWVFFVTCVVLQDSPCDLLLSVGHWTLKDCTTTTLCVWQTPLCSLFNGS